MSTLPATNLHLELTAEDRRSYPYRTAGAAVILAVLGLSSIRFTIFFLWDMWTTDALKSIGMLVPIASLVLILRAWRSLGWEMEGSWWGAVIVAVTIAAVHLRDRAILIFVFSPNWNIYLPPHSLVIFAYASGIVLLFGGKRLYRAALFPIVLLVFVNPVPHIFNVLVDLPLQRVSAHVARAFAMSLGQPLTPDQMRLMFTPNFGMFIAPGCNGIRGAVTMGFIALLAGYVAHFRWYVHTVVVMGAVLLGYLFNFARLCLLVLYYIVALHLPRLQNRAKLADYIIGACLFLLATQILFTLIHRLNNKQDVGEKRIEAAYEQTASCFSIRRRLVVLAIVPIFGAYGTARSIAYELAGDSTRSLTSVSAKGAFPSKIGEYALVRTWNETLVTGVLLFHWAEYAPSFGGSHISFGIAPVVGSHDTLICHSARGEDPVWRDQMDVVLGDRQRVSLSAALFNDGASQTLEASTICSASGCGEYTSDRKRFGFVYSKPDTRAIFSQDPRRPIPILLKAETPEATLPVNTAAQQLEAEVRHFFAQADMHALLQPYRQ